VRQDTVSGRCVRTLGWVNLSTKIETNITLATSYNMLGVETVDREWLMEFSHPPL
jgi:hypothetical protein